MVHLFTVNGMLGAGPLYMVSVSTVYMGWPFFLIPQIYGILSVILLDAFYSLHTFISCMCVCFHFLPFVNSWRIYRYIELKMFFFPLCLKVFSTIPKFSSCNNISGRSSQVEKWRGREFVGDGEKVIEKQEDHSVHQRGGFRRRMKTPRGAWWPAGCPRSGSMRSFIRSSCSVGRLLHFHASTVPGWKEYWLAFTPIIKTAGWRQKPFDGVL